MLLDPNMNPFKQIAFSFEFWAAAVFGLYSEGFRERYEYCFSVPGETQNFLTSIFWEATNEGWIFMQPEMIALQKGNELWGPP